MKKRTPCICATHRKILRVQKKSARCRTAVSSQRRKNLQRMRKADNQSAVLPAIRGKGTKMKWFELNNGNLVDLEKVCCIEIDARVIVYRFTEAESCAELFELPSKAQQRMEELKKLLK